MFPNGKFFTPSKLNECIRSLLTPLLGPAANNFSSHSFRAGIPAALADNPELAGQAAIMGWGRWSSDAYKTYTRLKYNQRKETFSKISNLFF
jgi:hypothetical protein